MKIATTALVSAISLLIAMSTPAYSAGPSLQDELNSPARKQAMARPKIPPNGKQTCSTTSFLLPASGASTNTGLGITFTIVGPRVLALIFSSEVQVAAGGTVSLDYNSLDSASPEPIGPEVFANDTTVATRTALGIAIVPTGTHTITPFLRTSFGFAGAVFFRCFSVRP